MSQYQKQWPVFTSCFLVCPDPLLLINKRSDWRTVENICVALSGKTDINFKKKMFFWEYFDYTTEKKYDAQLANLRFIRCN